MTQHKFFQILVNSARFNAKARLKKGRNEAGRCDVSSQDIWRMWNDQEGKCFYSGLMMMTETVAWQASLERLDPDLGYTEKNCVLCCLEFNHMTQWSQQKIQYLFFHMNSELIELRQGIFDAVKLKRKPYRKPNSKDPNVLWCVGCKQELSGDDLYNVTNNHQKCQKCVDAYEEWIESPRGHMMTLLRNARKRKQTFDLDFEYLVQLYYQQNGKCFYSEVAMTVGPRKNANWIMSLERLDRDIGYLKGNVALICWEFNTSHANSNWNREKMKLLKTTLQLKYSNSLTY